MREPAAPWLARLFHPNPKPPEGIPLADITRETELKERSRVRSKASGVFVRLASAGLSALVGTSPRQQQPLSSPQASTPASSDGDGQPVPAPSRWLTAQACLCLAVIQRLLPDTCALAAQAAMEGAEDSVQQLVCVCRSGVTVCLLINCMAPDTIDERALYTDPEPSAPHDIATSSLTRPPPLQPLMGDPTHASNPLPSLDTINTIDTHSTADVAFHSNTTPNGLDTAADASGASVQTSSPQPVDFEGPLAVPAKPHPLNTNDLPADGSPGAGDGILLQDPTILSLKSDWFDGEGVVLSPPGAKVGSRGFFGVSKQQREREQREHALWNWQLAHGSALALGCSLEGLSVEALAQGQVEEVVPFLLELIKCSYMQALSLEHAPGLLEVRTPAESDSDLACVPPLTLLTRWVEHRVPGLSAPVPRGPREPEHVSSHMEQAHSRGAAPAPSAASGSLGSARWVHVRTNDLLTESSGCSSLTGSPGHPSVLMDPAVCLGASEQERGKSGVKRGTEGGSDGGGSSGAGGVRDEFHGMGQEEEGILGIYVFAQLLRTLQPEESETSNVCNHNASGQGRELMHPDSHKLQESMADQGHGHKQPAVGCALDGPDMEASAREVASSPQGMQEHQEPLADQSQAGTGSSSGPSCAHEHVTSQQDGIHHLHDGPPGTQGEGELAPQRQQELSGQDIQGEQNTSATVQEAAQPTAKATELIEGGAVVSSHEELLQVAGRVVSQASELGAYLPMQAWWLLEGGAPVRLLLLLALARAVLTTPSPTLTPAPLTANQPHAHTTHELEHEHELTIEQELTTPLPPEPMQGTTSPKEDEATGQGPEGGVGNGTPDSASVLGLEAEQAGMDTSQTGTGAIQSGTNTSEADLGGGPKRPSAFAAALAAAQANSGSANSRPRLHRHSSLAGSGTNGSSSPTNRLVQLRKSMHSRSGAWADAPTSVMLGSSILQQREALQHWEAPALAGSGQGAGAVGGRAVDLQGADGEVDRQEERLLRSWLNSLLVDRGIRVTSLFDAAMCTGWPLLLACDVMAPGSVAWGRAFAPPYHGKRVPRKLMAVENGNQVCHICTRLWHLPLVNIGGIDIAEGHKGALMSLVWQLMRHHMILLLGPLVAHPTSSTPQIDLSPTASLAGACALGAHPTAAHSGGGSSWAGAYSAAQPPTHVHAPGHASHQQAESGLNAISGRGLLPSPGHTSLGTRGQFHQIEEEVLRWANSKLAAASGKAALQSVVDTGGVPAAGAKVWHISSLNDPCLACGEVLLALLAAIRPSAVNPEHVLPGTTPQNKAANARLVICVSRALGAKVYMGPDDLSEGRPRALLMLLAALIACDRAEKERKSNKVGN